MRLLNGSFDDTDRVGTVHDMRFVFLDNDTKLLFAKAYDGKRNAYIDDFVANIPDALVLPFSAYEGWPEFTAWGVKDWLVEMGRGPRPVRRVKLRHEPNSMSLRVHLERAMRLVMPALVRHFQVFAATSAAWGCPTNLAKAMT
jgi:hypothetical protein